MDFSYSVQKLANDVLREVSRALDGSLGEVLKPATLDDAYLFFTKIFELFIVTLRIIITLSILIAKWSFFISREISFFLWPYMKKGLIYVRDTDPVTKYVIIAVVSVVVVVWLLKREIQRRRVFPRLIAWGGRAKERVVRPYRLLQRKISRQSHILGALLPHIIYFSAVGVLAFVFPRLLENIVESLIFFLGVTIYPIIASIRAVRDNNANLTYHWLEFWVVFGVWMLILEVPFIMSALTLIPQFHKIQMIVFAWLILPLTNGAQGSYVHVRSLLHKYLPQVFGEFQENERRRPRQAGGRGAAQPAARGAQNGVGAGADHPNGAQPNGDNAAQNGQNEGQREPEFQVNPKIAFFFNMLVHTRVLSQQWSNRIAAMFSNGIVQIGISFMFIFSYGAITRIGCVLVGILYAMYASVHAMNLNTDTDVWLKYWCAYMFSGLVFTCLEGIVTWIPFIYHFVLVYTLYLQLPIFNGAGKVYVVVEKHLTHLERVLAPYFDKIKPN